MIHLKLEKLTILKEKILTSHRSMYANAVKHSKQSPLYIKLAMMLHKTYIDQS